MITPNFEEIRAYYAIREPQIIEHSRLNPKRWLDPYFGAPDFIQMFTPIEFQTWQALRSFGKLPMYPQYPVGKYFIDFGNPRLKVGIECDGKEWHTDIEKDKRRDEELLELGWRIYRISGSDCMKCDPSWDILNESNDFTEEEKYQMLRTFYTTTIEGLIKSISIFHTENLNLLFDEEINLAYRVLDKRRLVYDSYIGEVHSLLLGEYNYKRSQSRSYS